MSAQLSLVYDPVSTGRDSWRAQLDALRSAVNYLGLKEVAYALDVNGSTLCDAMNERDRKRWANEWTHVVLAMLLARRDPIATSLMRAVAGSGVAPAQLELAGDEEFTADELKAALAAIGEVRRRKRGR